MHTIKKYANRKLYHTNQKQYITLDGIAKLVQDGEAVHVLDNETGDDITPSILAQVVLQARGRSSPQLPTQLLTGLIQIGGDTLSSLRRNVMTYLGGADLVDAEIERRLGQLQAGGDITPEEARHWRQLLTRKEFSEGADQELADHADGMPSRNDVEKLHTQVDALTAIVNQLLHERGR
jgi:polyhydroxyalkanoate synthesis repressor PhaR